ncbi:MAG: GspH/FimT family pseudopilin [Burkholderiaceae bacterium]|jgi:type IV fimbrial biogenesis protein FimT|nr:GspH/FimT family pseudopilin [Burkholderiaceae bacterium]
MRAVFARFFSLSRLPERVGQKARGFTAIELLATVAIAAILLTVAAPSFVNMRRNSELVSATNVLVAAINAARGEAMKRGAYAYAVPADGDHWFSGVTVFIDKNLDQAFTPGIDEVILTLPAFPAWLAVTGTGTAAGSAPYIAYDGSGYAKTKIGGFDALTLSLARNDVSASQAEAQTRRIIIANTGRLRTCRPDLDKKSCTAAALQ